MQKFSSFGRKKKKTKIRHRMVMLRRLQLIHTVTTINGKFRPPPPPVYHPIYSGLGRHDQLTQVSVHWLSVLMSLLAKDPSRLLVSTYKNTGINKVYNPAV